jgi:hypothetical protein
VFWDQSDIIGGTMRSRDGDNLFPWAGRFLISSWKLLSRVGREKSVNVAARRNSSEANVVKASTSRADHSLQDHDKRP